MGRPAKIFLLLPLALAALGTSVLTAAEETGTGKSLGLESVVTTCYALGGDTATRKDPVEAIYVSKGNVKDAFFKLKEIIIEGKKADWTFKMKKPLCVIIFRGFFPGLSKIKINKVVFRDRSFEVFAEYYDAPVYSSPTQPAAIIPIGQLAPGKYDITLFVGKESRKKAEFKVIGH